MALVFFGRLVSLSSSLAGLLLLVCLVAWADLHLLLCYVGRPGGCPIWLDSLIFLFIPSPAAVSILVYPDC